MIYIVISIRPSAWECDKRAAGLLMERGVFQSTPSAWEGDAVC